MHILPISASPATIDRALALPTDNVVFGSLLGGNGAKIIQKRCQYIYLTRKEFFLSCAKFPKSHK